MIYLLDFAYSSGITESTVDKLLTGNTIKPRAVIFRGRGLNNSGKLADDAKFGEHKKIFEARGVPWGAYMVPVYPAALPGINDFWAQAADYLKLINAGGGRTIPPIIDAERIPGTDLPDPGWYRKQLRGATEYIYGQVKYYPIIYSNQSTFKDYLQTGTSEDGKWLAANCPLWIASPRSTPLMPPGWDRWAFWQFALDVKDFGGAADVDLDRWPGTYAEFLAWCKKPTVGGVPAYNPVEDGTTPPPDPDPEPDPEPQPGDGFTAADRETLAAIRAGVDKLAWLGK